MTFANEIAAYKDMQRAYVRFAEACQRLAAVCKIDRAATYPNGQPMFAPDGMMLDEDGNRSIFDDVDQ